MYICLHIVSIASPKRSRVLKYRLTNKAICEGRPPMGNSRHKSYQNNKRDKIERLYNVSTAAAAADNLHRIQEQ
jgi:hypothetical protein